MTPIVKNGSIILWGTATRDAKIRTGRSGNKFASFGIKYNRHHNVDGRKENEYMEVTVWEDSCVYVGDDDIGVAKGDTVLVCGYLVEDTFRKEGEDPNAEKWRISADIVLDMTSIFQVASLVVSGVDSGRNTDAHKESGMSDFDNRTPFDDDFDSEEGDLPY